MKNNIAMLLKDDGQPRAAQRYAKSASESKAIQSLKVLKDKLGFKQWHDKFSNALSQLYPDSSQLMQRMRRLLDQKRHEVTIAMWHEAAEEEGWETEKINRLSSDLYYILVEKTDDEVATRVSEGESNDGIMAYQRVYLWMAGISGQALNDRLGEILKPTSVKKAEDVADALSRWLEQIKHMDHHGTDYKLSIPIKVASMKTLLSYFRDQFENIYNTVRRDLMANDDNINKKGIQQVGGSGTRMGNRTTT